MLDQMPSVPPPYAPVTLDTLKKGESCIVTTISSENRSLKVKLLSMGIVPGTSIKVIAVAPLGDPITIQAMGYSLSLRMTEAHLVNVMPLSAAN